MKSIITKRLGLTAGLTGVLFAAGSLQAQTFEPGIDFTADVVSNYVFRGVDVHSNKFVQDGKSYGSFNMAPAFQPSLTFKFAEGWSLNVWGSFALTGRNDVDTDELLQAGPAGYDGGYLQAIHGAATTGAAVDLATIIATIEADPTGAGGDPLDYSAVAGQETTGPGFHKEQNGLKRNDEIDITLSYSVGSKLGTMSGGIVSYNYTNISQQLASNVEMFVGFAPAILPELSLTAYVDVATPGYSGSTYSYLAYTKAFEFGEGKNVTIAPGIGYATDTTKKIQGWKNANLPITLNLGGFHLGVTGVYRTDMRFFDSDTAPGDGIAYYGGSSMNDGLVVDPGQTNGIANGIVNYDIQQQIQATLPGYSYTARQHLPKLVYFYTVGYTMSF